MKRHKVSEPIPKQKNLTELQQHVELLERNIRRLQLEHDLLKKANELLKKGLGVATQHLSNGEKTLLVHCPKADIPHRHDCRPSPTEMQRNPTATSARSRVSQFHYFDERSAYLHASRQRAQTCRNVFQKAACHQVIASLARAQLTPASKIEVILLL